MKRILLTLFLLVTTIALVQGQEKFKRKADLHYSRLAYAQALPYFLTYYKKTSDESVILYIAECYRLTHEYDQALEWYEKAKAENVTFADSTFFYYSHTLLLHEDYEDAKNSFNDYFSYSGDSIGKKYLQFVMQIDSMLKDSFYYSIDNLPFNTKLSEFGAAPYKEGIVYASSRNEGSPIKQTFTWLDSPFLSFYYSKRKNEAKDSWSKGTSLKGDINSKYHESNLTISPATDKAYFTRNNYFQGQKGMSKENVIKLKIYSVRMDGMKGVGLQPFKYNDDQYNFTHPSLSADGNRLYYVSDKPTLPGHQGGKDLYYSEWNGAEWDAPVNLGPEINTPKDELFPFIHPDGTLYFSSNGHAGFGHLDIFAVRRPRGELHIMNLGYPINSAFDDFCYHLDSLGEEGYLSSNRPGGEGDDDIYAVHIERPTIRIEVVDSISQMPITNAQVTISDTDYPIETIDSTDGAGVLTFTADIAHSYRALVETEEFKDAVVKMNTRSSYGQLLFEYRVVLYNPPPAITGLVLDERTNKEIPGAEVKLRFTSNGMEETLNRTSDRYGFFRYKLQPTTYYYLDIAKEGYYAYADTFSTSIVPFDGDTVITYKLRPVPPPVVDLDEPVHIEKIYYGFDVGNPKDYEWKKLKKIANIMIEHPDWRIEIAAHTDSRGSDSYNMRLSVKRARSAEIWLINFGVARDRIKRKPKGETEPVNHCRNGVSCSDEEHQANRRSEFIMFATNNSVVMQTGEGYEGSAEEQKYPGGKKHLVTKGQTLFGLSSLYKVTVAQIKSWNSLRSDLIRIGETLIVSDPNVKPIVIEVDPAPVKEPEPIQKEPEPVVKEEIKEQEIIDEIGDTELQEDTLVNDPLMEIQKEMEEWEEKEQKKKEPKLKKEKKKKEKEPKVKKEKKVKEKKVKEKKDEVIEEVIEDPETKGPLIEALKQDEGNDNGGEIESGKKEEGDDEPGPKIGKEIKPIFQKKETGKEKEKETKSEQFIPDFKFDPVRSSKETVFRIQLGAFKGKLGWDSFEKLKEYKSYVIHVEDKGLNYYLVGEYIWIKDANQAAKIIKGYGYPGAYVTGWKEGKKLSFEELRKYTD